MNKISPQISYTWIKTSSIDNLSPITQVYGICFNDNNKILICRKDLHSEWQLPGGKPEKHETIQQTLQRELKEETNIIVQNIKLLGVQQVSYPDNPNLFEGNEFYQVRMMCDVSNIETPVIDLSTGCIWERAFIPFNKIKDYIVWEAPGEKMFEDAFKAKGLF